MQTEIYECKPIETVMPELHEMLKTRERRDRLVKELGLSGQQ